MSFHVLMFAMAEKLEISKDLITSLFAVMMARQDILGRFQLLSACLLGNNPMDVSTRCFAVALRATCDLVPEIVRDAHMPRLYVRWNVVDLSEQATDRTNPEKGPHSQVRSQPHWPSPFGQLRGS